jgi:hypothetical protein
MSGAGVREHGLGVKSVRGDSGKAEPGVIVHTRGPTSITFGELDGRVSERA